jgi:hypothetical protein
MKGVLMMDYVILCVLFENILLRQKPFDPQQRPSSRDMWCPPYRRIMAVAVAVAVGQAVPVQVLVAVVLDWGSSLPMTTTTTTMMMMMRRTTMAVALAVTTAIIVPATRTQHLMSLRRWIQHQNAGNRMRPVNQGWKQISHNVCELVTWLDTSSDVKM